MSDLVEFQQPHLEQSLGGVFLWRGMGHGAWGMGQGFAYLKVGAWGMGQGFAYLKVGASGMGLGKRGRNVVNSLSHAIFYFTISD
ncbi:hypothetical protein [Microcoleus sp. FACHB-68]|uniref:hypothetical protein n=1 Tax=Microcoleus sp. FACHB-68 TaxID=2692826 RepID=UPI001682DF3D|nr:hypothetical protein [Microcoleus sp. FACHB-68]MBD1939026.1 hypothetical protein [Microcoleus sp. FACHB-68]